MLTPSVPEITVKVVKEVDVAVASFVVIILSTIGTQTPSTTRV